MQAIATVCRCRKGVQAPQFGLASGLWWGATKKEKSESSLGLERQPKKKKPRFFPSLSSHHCSFSTLFLIQKTPGPLFFHFLKKKRVFGACRLLFSWGRGSAYFFLPHYLSRRRARCCDTLCFLFQERCLFQASFSEVLAIAAGSLRLFRSRSAQAKRPRTRLEAHGRSSPLATFIRRALVGRRCCLSVLVVQSRTASSCPDAFSCSPPRSCALSDSSQVPSLSRARTGSVSKRP